MNLYVNCSPKGKKSSTENIISMVKEENDEIFYLYQNNFSKMNIGKYDSIIFGYPLYVDSPPSKLIEYMEYINEKAINFKSKKIYIICNCGFLEPDQNNLSVDIMKSFCDKVNAIYMGSFKIGSGSIIGQCNKNKLYRVISIDYLKKTKKFRAAIHNKEKIELKTKIFPMTKKLYVTLANYSWRKKRKRNGLIAG